MGAWGGGPALTTATGRKKEMEDGRLCSHHHNRRHASGGATSLGPNQSRKMVGSAPSVSLSLSSTLLPSLSLRGSDPALSARSGAPHSPSKVGTNHDHTMMLLHRIADAVGAAPPNVSFLRNEIALLKREEEDMEARKRHAEALQLSQLIALLSSSEMVLSPPPAESPTTITMMMSPQKNNLINSFTCPLGCELMKDPVAIVCGHSFETCPTCSMELPSLDVTQNISLRSSVQEWKQRDAKFRLQIAISNLASDDPNVLNEALEILQAVMENTSHIAQVSQQGIAAKLVDLLKTNARAVNTKAALKCVYHLAHYSEENKVTAPLPARKFLCPGICGSWISD